MAAGLLATVVLMHVLWLKSEVDKQPLEALAVAGPDSEPLPSGRRRTGPVRQRPLRAREPSHDLEPIDDP
jgi:hypothetical protein